MININEYKNNKEEEMIRNTFAGGMSEEEIDNMDSENEILAHKANKEFERRMSGKIFTQEEKEFAKKMADKAKKISEDIENNREVAAKVLLGL